MATPRWLCHDMELNPQCVDQAQALGLGLALGLALGESLGLGLG